MTMIEQTSLPPLSPKVILGVVAHPDDLDFGMGGSIAKWVREGATAYCLVLTDGSKGSENPDISPKMLQSLRQREQQEAARRLGVTKVFFSKYTDGELEASQEVKRDIVRLVRRLKPDVVMTFDPTMVYSSKRGFINHPDHRAAGWATLDAVYPLARNRPSFPALVNDEQLEPYSVPTLLMHNLDQPNYFVDISQDIETKVAGLAAHVSQFGDAAGIVDIARALARSYGPKVGTEYAEGFVRIDIQ